MTRSEGETARPARGDVDDGAAALLAHRGQNGLDESDRAEEVGGEQFVNVVVAGLFDGGAVAAAGVVHQHVDGAETLKRGAHDVTPLLLVGDVERERERRIGM